MALVATSALVALASNPFTSSVALLTPGNWSVLQRSPHLWMVNVCRQSWGYCSLLTPKWEELANKLKHSVKIAYVDTEGGPTPAEIGQIRGTPTIKAFVPQRASAKNAKTMLDYDQAREVPDLVRFATSRMPSFVEPVKGPAELAALRTKAAEWGLPLVLVFSNKAGQTSSLLKALSAEYRRRVLIGELKKASSAAAAEEYAVKTFPTLIGLRVGGEGAPLRFEGKEPTAGRLDTFIGKVALRKPVLKKPEQSDGGGKEEL